MSMRENRMLGPRVLAALLLVVVGLLGMLGGIAMDRVVFRTASAATPPEAVAAEAPRDGEERRDHRARTERVPYVERLARDLSLTREQQDQIQEIVDVQHERIVELRREMHRITKDARAQIDSVLTAEQLARVQEGRRARAEREEAERARRQEERESGAGGTR